MSEKTAYQHIVRTPGVTGGKPRIEGHRITVQHIAIWHEQMGYSVDEIATLYDLTLAEIYSALAYYYDHREEIDQSIAQDEAFAEDMRAKTPSRLAQRLYERKGYVLWPDSNPDMTGTGYTSGTSKSLLYTW